MADQKNKITCPFCSNTYLEQIKLAQYDANAYRTTSVFTPATGGMTFFLYKCPACGEVFDSSSMMGINYKTLEEQKGIARSLKEGKAKREKSYKVELPEIPKVPDMSKYTTAEEFTKAINEVKTCCDDLIKQLNQFKTKAAKTAKKNSLDEEIDLS